MTTYDGQIWYPQFYDMDTILGIDNTGYLTIEPDVEIESGSYNTSNSNLWTKVWNYFRQELQEEWAKMRQGSFTLENLMNYIYGEQISKIPAKLYNDDAEVKYLQFGSLYTYCCHGSKQHLITRWLKERIAYVDSMLGYFTSQDDQVTIRMNKTGYVSFEVTPYIPLYFSVKWSNASGGTQTFKLARGETKTFYYTSTTSTDQEVIIYHAQYIKRLDNLSNLNPSSCILANATKLTNVEIHSTELYNINVTNNAYLRNLDLRDCTALGTVTATGSSLDLSNCKYLKYVDVYNTNLTEVQSNTSGGSLVEIYYPKTVQSITLIKQRLLEIIGLPYGEDGEEVPTSLYTIDIEECPSIKYLNTSTDADINTTFASMYYCNNLTLRNTFDLQELTFDGFHRLKNVTIENMYNLESVGFNNLLSAGSTPTLKYVGFSNCPLLEKIELNCDSNDYEISFADDSTLNFGGLSSLKTIESNCVIKGLDYLIVPLKLENMFFTNEYGEGFSELRNIWSSSVCTVSITGSTVTTKHVTDGYEGIDFAGMNLKNIDLGALVNIPQAINFSLSPTTVNPNFNLNRDGVTYPYLQPVGTLDLSNYTESLARFFDGVDLRQLQLICNNELPQTDLSYCFYNSTFEKDSQISAILDNIDTVTNMEYCFYKTAIKDISILNSINFLAGTSLAYCFAECANISKLQNITLSGNIGDASYMFSGCGVTTIKNISTSCNNIVGMFSNCYNLVTVTNFDANGTTSYESLFEGCRGMSVAPVTEIPATITNISKMYKNCDGLVSMDGFVLHGNITNVSEFIGGCDNLINANNVTISGPFYNEIFRGITSIRYVNNLLINYVGRSMTFAHMFDGCSNLTQMSFHDDSYVKDVLSLDYMFAGTSMTTVDFSNVNFEKITSIKYMFANCSMEEFSYTVPDTIISIQGFLSGCSNLKTLRNFIISTNVTTLDWLADTNVENLIDCSFNTLYTNFTDNTSIKVVENLEYTGTDFSNYFNGCTNLESATVNITNATTKAENTFANCPNLTIVDFNESDLSNVTSINGMFNGDTSLTTINNLNITKSSTTANNTTLVGCPISNTDGLYINSNNALDMFRLGEESEIVAVTDFELGENVDDLSGLFANNTHITHDIVIPSHVSTVENMYYNCIALEYVNSNWSNSYDLNVDSDPNNDVVTTNCYGECTNIKYIDNELYMNEYGELTAIYSIPEEWGGIANYGTNQTAFYINSDLLTDYTITLNGDTGTYVTEWGDGTTDKRNAHTYSKSGIFRIVTNNTETFGTGSQIPDNFRDAIIRVLHLDETITNGSHLFDGCTNLLTIKPLSNTFNSVDYMFNNCTNLLDVDLSGVTFGSFTSAEYMCNGCSKFTISPISLIPDSCTNISYIFANSDITDIRGMTFGSSISTYTNWNPPNLENMRNTTIKTNVNLLRGNTTLKYIDGLTRPNTTTWTNYFYNCSSLIEDLVFPSNTTNVVNCFYGCSNMTHVHSNWDKTYSSSITSTDCYTGCIGITHIDNENVISYEGDCGLDYLPLDWGGRGFEEDITSIMEVTATTDNFTWQPCSHQNHFTLKPTSYISWGDGEVTEVTDFTSVPTHTYAEAGTYIVKSHSTFGSGLSVNREGMSKLLNVACRTRDLNTGITSNVTAIHYAFNGASTMTYADISNFNKYGIQPTNIACLFQNCPSLETIIGLEDLDLSKCTNMTNAFSNCSSLQNLNLSKWNVSSITNISNMFTNCVSLTSIDVSNWNTSKVTNLDRTFYGCANLPTVTGIGDWDMSKVTNMSLMFYLCSSLKEIDVTNWNCGNTGNGMFQGCSALESIIGIENLVNSKWTSCNSIFRGCSSLTEIKTDNWDLSNVTDFGGMFQDCQSITSLDLSNFDFTLKPTAKFPNMFANMSNLIDLKLPSYFKGDSFAIMFSGCSKLTDLSGITFEDTTSNKDTEGTNTGMTQMFYNCTSLKYIGTLINRGGNRNMFVNCSSLESIEEFQYANDYADYDSYLMFNGINGSVLLDINFTCTGLGPAYFTGNTNNNTFNKPDFTRDTIVKLFNCLSTHDGSTSIGSSTHPLTFKSTTRARLTDDDIAIATAKGWTIA